MTFRGFTLSYKAHIIKARVVFMICVAALVYHNQLACSAVSFASWSWFTRCECDVLSCYIPELKSRQSCLAWCTGSMIILCAVPGLPHVLFAYWLDHDSGNLKPSIVESVLTRRTRPTVIPTPAMIRNYQIQACQRPFVRYPRWHVLQMLALSVQLEAYISTYWRTVSCHERLFAGHTSFSN